MSSPTPITSTSHYFHTRSIPLVLRACQADDVSLISEAISVASSPNSQDTIEEALSKAVRWSIRRFATNVLTYVLTHSAKVPTDSNLSLENHSIEILEILLSHGWDINARHRIGWRPFLWEAIYDGDLVAWCLERGATTIPKDLYLEGDSECRQEELGCPPILELAAGTSTVATFELLRSKGGQLGRQTLHFAAERAVNSGNRGYEQPGISDKDRARTYSERMAMVIHLVDTLGFDPNALDQPVGWMLPNHWGTPLCYLARSNPNWDFSEVVQFLLQRGADPALKADYGGYSAIDLAAEHPANQQFLELVENWKKLGN